MAVPNFQSMFLPVLRATADRKEHPMAEIREKVAEELRLSPEDLSQKLPSGGQTVFANRASWSAIYLHRAGALERTKRGVFRITERGRELLSLPAISLQVLNKYPEFSAFHKGSETAMGESQQAKSEKSETPEEQLANAYKVLRAALANDVLEPVKKASPSFFEELVVKLLVAMGFGGSVEDAGRAIGKSGDGGIDGRPSKLSPAVLKGFGRERAYSSRHPIFRKTPRNTCRKSRSESS